MPSFLDVLFPIVLAIAVAVLVRARPAVLLIVGVVLSVAYWGAVGVLAGYEDLDGGWAAAFVLIVPLYVALWSAGVGVGYLLRKVL